MKKRILLLSVLLLFVAALFSCNLFNQDTTGTLKVSIAEEVSARTILPNISMDPAAYEVTGSGPQGAEFTETVTDESLTVESLPFGEWTVTVTALNENDTPIGEGSGTVTVHSNETSTLSVTVVPFAGEGSLSLSLNWNEGDVETPQVEASLQPAEGEARVLDFTIDGSQASFSADDVAAGYHTLTVKLLDNGALTMGAVEVVRIVADAQTEGSFTFDEINKPGGSIEVHITPQLENPLEVSIEGAAETKPENQVMALSASVADYQENVSYVWYVNGNAAATGDSYSFDESWAQGYYRIDVTAFSTDGRRAGSAGVFVEVVE